MLLIASFLAHGHASAFARSVPDMTAEGSKIRSTSASATPEKPLASSLCVFVCIYIYI